MAGKGIICFVMTKIRIILLMFDSIVGSDCFGDTGFYILFFLSYY